MKFNFRKIVSVLASTVMLSSTVALAAAANYPAPFVQGGNADVAVVYGSSAAVTDLVAVSDIQTQLASTLAQQTAIGGSGTTVSGSGGDFIALDRPSSKLHLGRGTTDVFGRSVTSTDMDTLLANGIFTSDGDNTDHDYTQKVDVANLTLRQFDDSDYATDSPTLGVRIGSGDEILNYTLSFTDKPDFNDNLKNSDIAIMGKSYFVLDQKNATTTPSLTLLDSASTQNWNEAETKSVTVGGTTYAITVTDISSDSKVKVSVGGKTSSSLAVGATYKIADGVYIGVKDVSYKSKDTAVSNADLSVGAGKLTLKNGNEVEMNDDSINNLYAWISNSSGKLNSVTIEWKADDDMFITPNSSIIMPGFGSLKLSMAGGMVFPSQEEITVKNDGKYTVQLRAPIKDGDATISLLSNNATNSNFTIIGKDYENKLRTSNTSSITFDGDTDKEFVASWASGKDAESYLLYATSFRDDNGVNKTTIKGRVGTFSQEVQQTDSIVLGNVVLTVGAIDKNGKSVVLTGNSGTSFNRLYTATGLTVILPFSGTGARPGELNATGGGNYQSSSFGLIFSEEDKDGNIGVGKNITLTLGLTGTDSYVTVSNAAFTTGSSFEEIGSSDKYQGYSYSALGTKVLWDQGPTQQTATLTYNGAESYGQIVLADIGTSISGGSSSGGSVKSLGSVIVSDNEVSSVSSKNLIVVGGSCVNTVAATLLGSSSPLCGANWETATGAGSGSFLIKTYTSPYASNKIATLVAGYNGQDTTNAAKALQTQSIDTSVGKKYTGNVATSVTLATS